MYWIGIIIPRSASVMTMSGKLNKLGVKIKRLFYDEKFITLFG